MGLPVWIDAEHAIAHNKVIICDKRTVITGSYNFSRSAEERNAENLLIIEGMPKIAASYVESFRRHREHCQPYRPPPDPAARRER